MLISAALDLLILDSIVTHSGQNVFITDLHHAGGVDEEINRLLSEIPSDTHRIFLLGDIFHYWVNDPAFIQTQYSAFLLQLKKLAGEGLQLFFLEGNRDFLASHFFEDQEWIDVVGNPTVFDLGGRSVYLGHGDELCWNDWAYQLYKSFIRSKPLRFLADRLPVSWRVRTAHSLSQASQTIVAGKTAQTLEIPQRAYLQVISAGVDVIVHGHLHKTYQREYRLGDRNGKVFCFGWKDGKRNLIHFAG